MIRTSFDTDRKYCPNCDAYVRYLSSPDQSWCTTCDGKVSLFSKEDHERFLRELPRATSPFRSSTREGEFESAG